MIEVMTLTENMPEIQLIVISAANVGEVGMELSPEVEAAVPEVIRTIKELLTR
jgi:hydrogenase maturation protease